MSSFSIGFEALSGVLLSQTHRVGGLVFKIANDYVYRRIKFGPSPQSGHAVATVRKYGTVSSVQQRSVA
jgi:hypothetical protein